MRRSTAVVLGVAIACAAWLLRYQLVAVPPAGAYLLDRWTGSVELLIGDKHAMVGRP